MSNSVQPHRQQPTRLPHPWDSPGKNTAVGCHFPLQCMKVKSGSEVAQSCLTLSDPLDCGLPGSSVPGILQARILEWVAISFSNACVQFIRSVMSNSLRPHESQHTRPPCPSPSPGVHSDSCPSSHAIQPSHPLLSPSPPAPNPSQHQGLFQ